MKHMEICFDMNTAETHGEMFLYKQEYFPLCSPSTNS